LKQLFRVLCDKGEPLKRRLALLKEGLIVKHFVQVRYFQVFEPASIDLTCEAGVR
jgi:hypothetical protein